jgi:hypothetical protein
MIQKGKGRVRVMFDGRNFPSSISVAWDHRLNPLIWVVISEWGPRDAQVMKRLELIRSNIARVIQIANDAEIHGRNVLQVLEWSFNKRNSGYSLYPKDLDIISKFAKILFWVLDSREKE